MKKIEFEDAILNIAKEIYNCKDDNPVVTGDRLLMMMEFYAAIQTLDPDTIKVFVDYMEDH